MVIAWKGLLYILSDPFGNPSFKGGPDNIQLDPYNMCKAEHLSCTETHMRQLEQFDK